MTNDTRIQRWPVVMGGLAVLGVALLLPATTSAQEAPETLHAYYVPSSGVIYRIKGPDLKDECTGKKHVEFSWTDAEGADHGALTGLEEDDHPHYLLADGTRALSGNLTASGTVTAGKFVGDGSMLTNLPSGPSGSFVLADGITATTNGFAVTGAEASGDIPISGAGTRLMWYPGKAAFRAGDVSGTQWDDANIAVFSTAMGQNPIASGQSSTAMGGATTASGFISTAMGQQ